MCCDTIIATTLEHITELEPSALDSSAKNKSKAVPTTIQILYFSY